jgi:hypothetical protein
MDTRTITGVVIMLVTPKWGVTTYFHCENPIKGGKRVILIPYIYHNIVKGYCYQLLNSLFMLTTKMTRIYQFFLSRASPGKTQYPYSELGRWKNHLPFL